jgi:SAM-dependent methyltransferase
MRVLVSLAGLAVGGGAVRAESAKEILKATGVQGGLVVHLGCGDGKLTAALRANDRYLVHGLDADPGNVRKAREHVHAKGLYGPVSIDGLAGKLLPYADNLANLVVGEDGGRVAADEILRVLRPGGVAYTKKGGRWVLRRKAWPETIDQRRGAHRRDAENHPRALDSHRARRLQRRAAVEAAHPGLGRGRVEEVRPAQRPRDDPAAPRGRGGPRVHHARLPRADLCARRGDGESPDHL